MKRFSLMALLAISTLALPAQQEDFTGCVAAFLNQSMIVDEYSPEGKCVVSSGASGMLSLRPVSLEAGKAPVPGEKLPFRLAIRDQQSGTLISFSDTTYREIELAQVLKQCRKGDSIVVLTTERQWALPHSEIRVE